MRILSLLALAQLNFSVVGSFVPLVRCILRPPDSHHTPKRMGVSGNGSEKYGEIRALRNQPPRPNDNTYWVTENFLAGEYPTDKRSEEESRKKIQKYLDVGIDFFVDLTQEGERGSYQRILKEEATKTNRRARYWRLPVQDFGIPTKEEMQQILDTIDSAIADNKKVYVHCRGGIGRTGTTVGCYLARHGYGGEEALTEVNRLFQNSNKSYESSFSPETRAQKTMVKEWKE